MTVSLAQLLVRQTKEQIFSAALSVASAVGLNVTTWQPGDPTRSLLLIESELLDALEEVVAGYVASGFLRYATGAWLKLCAKEVYNIDVPPATYASTTLSLTNGGGGVYDIEPGDLIFRNATTGKTYRNTSGGHLGSLGSLNVDVVADEPGAASTAAPGEISSMVTTLLGVTCTNATAAVGIDEQDESVTRSQCSAKLGSLSPNGPADAFRLVALSPELSGTNAVNRVRVFADSDTGHVRVLLAGPSGAVAAPVPPLVEQAMIARCTPLCMRPVVASATASLLSVTYELWCYRSINMTPAEVESAVADALAKMISERPIGGDVIPPATDGAIYISLIESTIRGISPHVFRVVVSAPVGDVAFFSDRVAVLHAVTATVHMVDSP